MRVDSVTVCSIGISSIKNAVSEGIPHTHGNFTHPLYSNRSGRIQCLGFGFNRLCIRLDIPIVDIHLLVKKFDGVRQHACFSTE